LYFESDQTLYPGEDVFLGAISQTGSSGSHLLFEVRIIWQKKLHEASFQYGYGGKFLNTRDGFLKDQKSDRIKRSTTGAAFNAETDGRKYRRRAYNQKMLFKYDNEDYEGFVTNISPAGTFVKTALKSAHLGAALKLMLPSRKSGKHIEIHGWIVRMCPEGLGLSFERRSGRERRSDLDRRTGLERRGLKRRKARS
jgi:hypothetical protein